MHTDQSDRGRLASHAMKSVTGETWPVPAKQLRTLRAMPMRVHADLHEGLGDRARAVGNAGIFQKAGKVRFRGGTEPGHLLIVKAAGIAR